MNDKYWYFQRSFDVLLDVLKPVNLSIAEAANSSLADMISVSGCITLDKCIRGKTLLEIEKEHGFKEGSMRSGMIVAALTRLPYRHEFDIRGYEKHPFNRMKRINKNSQEVQALKHTTIKHVWRTYGPNCVVKVMPAISYKKCPEPETGFIPENGICQWVMDPFVRINALVVGRVNNYPFGRYS